MNWANKKIRKAINRLKISKTRKRWIKEENKYFERFEFPYLTNNEIQEVKQVWQSIPFTKQHLNGHRIYKKINGFDANYLSMPVYDPIIIRSLNPYRDACVFVNKGLFDRLFNKLPQPKYFVKRIGNHFYNNLFELINEEAAVAVLEKQEAFIIKPSQASHGGAGIQLFKNYLHPENIRKLISQYKGDFIIQEIVQQHTDTKIFNPTSLNTIRILSLFINGKVSILKAAFRCGQNGSLLDNATTGGLMTKINPDGTLGEFGVDTSLQKIFVTQNGIVIKDHRIRHYPAIEQIVLNNHAQLYPTLHLIAWDFAIDQNGNPLFIEGNTKVPGIFWVQLCAGPIFGERTKEVIDYVRLSTMQF